MTSLENTSPPPSRTATVHRKTNETEITLSLNLDGTGQYQIDTGIGFLDHMLALMARHGFLDLSIEAKGDLHIDSHHTVEDIGIVLGMAIAQALADKAGIKRYGSAIAPMDETLALCVADLSGRSYLYFDAAFTAPQMGAIDTEMFREFFQAVSANAGMNLHIKVLHGQNNHHMAEAIFKSFGRALSEAVSYDSRVQGVLSTKGVL